MDKYRVTWSLCNPEGHEISVKQTVEGIPQADIENELKKRISPKLQIKSVKRVA